MLPDASADPSSCPFMTRLVVLLGDMPGEGGQRHVAFVERIDQLDDDARQHGAPETTLAAIKGARVLLALSA